MKHEELFDKYLQRSLSEADAEELKVLLQKNADAGREFVEHITEASLLVRVGSQMQTATAERTFSFRWKPVAAIAACLLLLATLAWWFLSTGAPINAQLASVTGEILVDRGHEVLTAKSGFRLTSGDLVRISPQSHATMMFHGGATQLELLSGAQARIVSTRFGKRVELYEGAVEGMVRPEPSKQPLTLITLHAQATVLGTRFLLASEVSSTRLEVTEGVVEFRRRSGGGTLLVSNGFSSIAAPNTEFVSRPSLPSSWTSRDIGSVRLPGQARFDGECFRVKGAGQDTCCRKDQLHFVYQPLNGDGEIQARIRDLEFTDPEAKASLMIRHSLETASPQFSLGVTASGRLELEHRTNEDSRIQKLDWTAAPCWLKVKRRGNDFSAYYSGDGTNWILAGSRKLPIAGRFYIGLGVTSFNHSALSSSTFDHVNIAALNNATPQ